MYVAVKGGEKAIAAAHALQAHRRRGDERLPELSVAQIEQQLNLAVDRVMTEGGIADRELAGGGGGAAPRGPPGGRRNG
ncbi:carbon-phosphorus lyase complex subunit PhnI, partial [Enterobacter asburiae]|uniref:carbon-phosphorus lyase complex subunit PhnI n=1 Tax=Enterobacter asburiae TaxID=61645 RepID=UPI003D6DF55B